MKTGLELIIEERQEQIEKHGWTLEHDRRVNSKKQLQQAAGYCMMLAGFGKDKKGYFWPSEWSRQFEHKIIDKDRVGQLTVAGAFLMAENQRRGDRLHETTINEIAAEIDRIQNKKE